MEGWRQDEGDPNGWMDVRVDGWRGLMHVG